MAFEADRARTAYRDALAALPAQDRRAQRPGLIMGAIYVALLDELARERYQVLHQRIALTPLRKFYIAWRTWVFGAAARP
jgi:phytoene synthase